MFKQFEFINHTIGGKMKTKEKNDNLNMVDFTWSIKRFAENYELKFSQDNIYQLLSNDYFREMVKDAEGNLHDAELILIKK